VGQLGHEPDGVGEHDVTPVLQRQPAHGRIEGREQTVLHLHVRAGDPVQQRGLAGVGVADQRHLLDLFAVALRGLGGTDAAVVLQVAAQLGHPPHDAPAVHLQLRLTGTTATDPGTTGDPSTGLP